MPRLFPWVPLNRMMTTSYRPVMAGNPTPHSRAVDWAGLVARSIHPAKVAILEALHCIGLPLSATELSEMLKEGGFSFDSIHYHLSALAKLAVVEEGSSRQAHAPRERYYTIRRLD